jgi:hypothetical protein
MSIVSLSSLRPVNIHGLPYAEPTLTVSPFAASTVTAPYGEYVYRSTTLPVPSANAFVLKRSLVEIQ